MVAVIISMLQLPGRRPPGSRETKAAANRSHVALGEEKKKYRNDILDPMKEEKVRKLCTGSRLRVGRACECCWLQVSTDFLFFFFLPRFPFSVIFF